MSWFAGLSVGTSFAEFTAINSLQSDQSFQKRWYLPKLSLTDGVKSVLSEHPEMTSVQLTVTTQTAEWVVDRRRGGPMAWLGTAGLETWPMLMIPATPGQDARPQALVYSDFVFGLSERTHADGVCDKPVSDEELEFLVAKLEMAKVKDVAIGFMHSTLNPQNEKRVYDYLSGRGFIVQMSHTHSQCTQELERWRLAILDAYVAHEIVALREMLATLKTESEQIQEISFVEGGSPYLSQFEMMRTLARLNKSSDTLLLHLGVEQFVLLAPGETMSEWRSEFCPLTVELPRFMRLNTQPTQMITTEPWRGPTLSTRQSGYEPGPMVFGKSFTPTLVDALSLIHGSKKLSVFDGLLNDRAEKRILEVLFTAAKDWVDTRTTDQLHVARSLLDLAYSQIAQDLLMFSERKKVIVSGSFAPLFMPALKRLLPQHQLRAGSEFAESHALAQLGRH